LIGACAVHANDAVAAFGLGPVERAVGAAFQVGESVVLRQYPGDTDADGR